MLSVRLMRVCLVLMFRVCALSVCMCARLIFIRTYKCAMCLVRLECLVYALCVLSVQACLVCVLIVCVCVLSVLGVRWYVCMYVGLLEGNYEK